MFEAEHLGVVVGGDSSGDILDIGPIGSASLGRRLAGAEFRDEPGVD